MLYVQCLLREKGGLLVVLLPIVILLPTIPKTDQTADMQTVKDIYRTDLDVEGVISGFAFATDCPIAVCVHGHMNSNVQFGVV